MSKGIETSLIVVKETKFDKIRRYLFSIIFKEEYRLIREIDELVMQANTFNKVDTSKIVIPKEIGKGKKLR